MSANNEYKMFRNYMANELQITRNDIEKWTKDAVAKVAEKTLGQIDIEGICLGCLRREIGRIEREIIKNISQNLADRLDIV